MAYTCTLLVYHLEALPQSIIIFKNKDKSCIHLEMNTKVQTMEIFQEKGNERVYN